MADDDRATQPSGGVQLVSYALGELDADSQVALERRVQAEPALREELEEIRDHMRLHQQMRKVAPRRGSFERLRSRMKKDAAFDGAIPGVHCMLRRSFGIALLVGVIAVTLLLVFTVQRGGGVAPDVIGEIRYTEPIVGTDQPLEVVDRAKLVINRPEPYKTGVYEAFIWLPTGISNVNSELEAAQNTEFNFTSTRRVELATGTLRRMEIQPGSVGEGPFIVATPHCKVEVDAGALSITVAPDGTETRISVGRGSARVYGLDAERSIPVTAGYCTSVERGKLPYPARPVLKLMLERVSGSAHLIEATMVNDGYEDITIRRSIDNSGRFAEPIYLLHISHSSEYTPGTAPENVSLDAWPVTPQDPGNPAHSGTETLKPKSFYRFNFDISSMLLTTPRVVLWLRLEYRGDLYGAPGEARVKIQSENLKLDLRTR
jgi:hypothetical protein